MMCRLITDDLPGLAERLRAWPSAIAVRGAMTNALAVFADENPHFTAIAVVYRHLPRCGYRLWTSLDDAVEGGPPASEAELSAFRQFLHHLRMVHVDDLKLDTPENGNLLLGAIHERWLPAVADFEAVDIRGPFHVYSSADDDICAPPPKPVEAPPGYVFRQGTEQDLELMEELTDDWGMTGRQFSRPLLYQTTVLAPAHDPAGAAVAWCVEAPDQAISKLAAVPEHRRKGFATVVALHRAQQPSHSRPRMPPFCFICCHNEASQALAAKFLVRRQRVYWAYLPFLRDVDRDVDEP